MATPSVKTPLDSKVNSPILVPRVVEDDSGKLRIPNVADFTALTGTEVMALVVTTLKHKNVVDPTDETTFMADFAASRVWNAVWNDYADFQLLNDELIPGKCYIDTADGAKICTERCQISVIGLATDTFAQAVGTRRDQVQVPIAVAGWALAYVDKSYPCGTPLTNDENGNLTEMSLDEKRDYPERLVAIYKKQEHDQEFGPEGRKIKVNNRHWVKVK